MRRMMAAFTAVMVFVFCFAGCGNKQSAAAGIDTPVTMEQVNTESRYVARAFLESIYSDDEVMFRKCYPDGFIDSVTEASGSNIFESYKNVMNINAVVTGTSDAGYQDFCVANGFDEAGMRSRISFLTGLDYSEIGIIRIQKVSVVFKNSAETAVVDFYYIVYESGGSWYMLEGFKDEAGF